MYALVQDGEVVREGAPAVWISPNGEVVTGFRSLPASQLASYGWLPIVDTPVPDHNNVTHQVVQDGWRVHADHVERIWAVRPLPPPTPMEQAETNIGERADLFLAAAGEATAFLRGVHTGEGELTTAQITGIVRAMSGIMYDLVRAALGLMVLVRRDEQAAQALIDPAVAGDLPRRRRRRKGRRNP